MSSRPRGETLRSDIGADLRRLRKLRKMTLSSIATATERSVGFWSQVERGLSEPSITDLYQATRILEIPLSRFFVNDEGPPEERGRIVRARGRRRVGNPEGGLIEELLSPDLGGKFETFRSEFTPGAEMKEPQIRQTEEAGYVITGELEIWIGGRHFHLYPGDSFRFRHESYRWRNPGEHTTVVIWVIAPPVY